MRAGRRMTRALSVQSGSEGSGSPQGRGPPRFRAALRREGRKLVGVSWSPSSSGPLIRYDLSLWSAVFSNPRTVLMSSARTAALAQTPSRKLNRRPRHKHAALKHWRDRACCSAISRISFFKRRDKLKCEGKRSNTSGKHGRIVVQDLADVHRGHFLKFITNTRQSKSGQTHRGGSIRHRLLQRKEQLLRNLKIKHQQAQSGKLPQSLQHCLNYRLGVKAA